MNMDDNNAICPNCYSTFDARLGRKYCSNQCRIKFHNKHISSSRKLPKAIIRKAMNYMHNNELLKELMQRGESRIGWSRLIESGFKEDCFVPLAYHNNSSESFKIGNYHLVKDDLKGNWNIKYEKNIRRATRRLK